jgi:[1-hydroxy-2-(trimethylamino)ethyl]phosphonate dioxygenase
MSLTGRVDGIDDFDGFDDLERVIDLYRRWGPVFYDERVSQLDHALQCATLARRAGAPTALVAAALLHDIGHLVELERSGGQVGDLTVDRSHEQVAARALSTLFPQPVIDPIALHVEAKRYLCAVDPTYHASLSPGSVRSLETQGGPMSTDEVSRFECLPGHRAAADLRRWDDAGKIEHLVVAPLDSFIEVLHEAALSL